MAEVSEKDKLPKRGVTDRIKRKGNQRKPERERKTEREEKEKRREQ